MCRKVIGGHVYDIDHSELVTERHGNGYKINLYRNPGKNFFIYIKGEADSIFTMWDYKTKSLKASEKIIPVTPTEAVRIMARV